VADPCLSNARSWVPAAACHSAPTRPSGCGHCYPQTSSFIPTHGQPIPKPHALCPTSSEATSRHGGVDGDSRSLSSLLPPLIPTAPVPRPSPLKCNTTSHRSSPSLGPQSADSGPSAPYQHINPGTRGEPNSQPVTRASSTSPQQFQPPSHPPPAGAGSGFTATYYSVPSDPNLPAYEEGPQTIRHEKWPLDKIYVPEDSKGGSVKSNTEKGKQRLIEWEKLVEDVYVPVDEKKHPGIQRGNLPGVQRGNLHFDLRPGDP